MQNNVQRQKSAAVLAREAAAMEGVVAERARRRREATLRQNQANGTVKEPLPERGEEDQTRDLVGEALGISGKTARAISTGS